MRLRIPTAVWRAGHAVWSVLRWVWRCVSVAVGVVTFLSVLAIITLLYEAFGWQGFIAIGALVFLCRVMPSRPDAPAPSAKKRGGSLHDKTPWYMQSQYRFHHGPTHNHRGDW